MRPRHIFPTAVSSMLLCLAGCDSSSSTSPQTSGPTLLSRSQWLLTDTGTARTVGDTLVMTTHDIPHWQCDGSTRVLDTFAVVNRISLDAQGNPLQLLRLDTLTNGTIIQEKGLFSKVETGVWSVSRNVVSVVSYVPKDSTNLAVRTELDKHAAYAVEIPGNGTARVSIAAWDFAPALLLAYKNLPSGYTVTSPSANIVQIAKASTGEVVTMTYSIALSGPVTAWTSTQAGRTPTTTGGEPTTCPQATSPSWLTSF